MTFAVSHSIPATRTSHRLAFGAVVTGGAVAGALLTTAEPTGLAGADMFWSAALVAVLALFCGTARRWTWFVPAGVGALLAGDTVAAVCAAAAIVIAFVSMRRGPATRPTGALVGALGGIALLRAGPVGFHGSTAILTFVAVVPPIVSGYRHADRAVRRWARGVAFVGVAILLLIVVGAGFGGLSVIGELRDGAVHLDRGLNAARDADDMRAADELDRAALALAAADRTLSSWFVTPARSLPVVGPNLDAVRSLATESSEVAGVSAAAAAEADVDLLRFDDGHLDPAAVRAMEPPLTSVNHALEDFASEVLADRSPWLLEPVDSRLERIGDQVDEAISESRNALAAVKVGPSLLGADGPRRYLVLFTTPVEARGRIGFPGNYAELVLDDGQMSMPVFGRVTELERGAGNRTLTRPPDFVRRYSRFDVANTWRNLTMTPDFRSLALAAGELYPQSTGRSIDGVINIDPIALAQLMQITGPVEVDGLDAPLTADNAADYLLRDQYVRFGDDNEARIAVLDRVARTTFNRLTTSSLPEPSALSDIFDPLVDGGHIMFSPSSYAKTTFEDLIVYAYFGIDGGFVPLQSGNDLVTVTTTNGGGNKIDLYLHRRERYDVTWDPDTGEVRGTLRVTLENQAPAEGLPGYVIGNLVDLPRGTNRSFLSLYSRLGLDAARIDGQPATLRSEVELGTNVYSTFVDIPPGASKTVEVDVSGTIEGRRYVLDLASQPFATTDELDLEVTVVGADPVSRDAEVDGDTVTWSGPLDERRQIEISAPR